MRDKAENTDQNDAESLKDMAVLNDENLIGGVPGTLLFGGLAFIVGLTLTIRSAWYIGIIIGFIYFMLIFMIHKDDPNAVRGWQRALRRPTRWRAGYYKKRNIINLNHEE